MSEEQVITFDAEIEASDSGGAYISFPYNVEETFGVRGRVPVQATFDGHPYQGSLVKMGTDCHILLVRKDVREAIAKQPGDSVHVTVQKDTAPRVVEVPEDFQAILAENPEAKDFFSALSYTHQREYVNWITEAKRETTRQRRMNKAIEMLCEKKKAR